MHLTEHIEHKIFELQPGDSAFESLALEVFRFQYAHNETYRKFCQALGQTPDRVHRCPEIPFLPVELFKKNRVASFKGKEARRFTSSATTGNIPSTHYVYDVSLYERSFLNCFRMFYGKPSDWCILALLPSYLERQGSSLVYMVSRMIEESRHPGSGFYLNEFSALARKLEELSASGQQTLLIGVSFALVDLAATHPMLLQNTVVMETGGMKGRHREMIREELHAILCKAFHQEVIHSEYGMTELFSQAYSRGNGLFSCPPWMRVLIRDGNDPLEMLGEHQTGGINVIDLANLYSCSFIATEDLGVLRPGERFEVLGRFDSSEVRGCNLMLDF